MLVDSLRVGGEARVVQRVVRRDFGDVGGVDGGACLVLGAAGGPELVEARDERVEGLRRRRGHGDGGPEEEEEECARHGADLGLGQGCHVKQTRPCFDFTS